MDTCGDGLDQEKALAGVVVAVCTSRVRTEPKEDCGTAWLIADYGIEGDAHAGLGDRQVSLLGIEGVEELNRSHRIGATAGSLVENITTRGIDLLSLAVGQHLQIGSAVLEVVRIGKAPDEPHTYSFKGFCLLPTQGVFCRVVSGGRISNGDVIRLIEHAGRPGRRSTLAPTNSSGARSHLFRRGWMLV